MKKINWVRKLTSRKLWTAVASFVSMMIVATGGAENTATQVTALIMAGASVVAYIIGEGLTRYLACAAGAVRHPQLFSAHKPEQVFRPGIVIHILHERVVHAREITIH